MDNKEYQKEYYKKNKAKVLLRCKIHYAAHKEDYKKYRKEYYLKNKEKARVRGKKRYEENKPAIAAQRKIYLLKRKYNLTPEEYANMCNKQNNSCAICKQELKLKIDHDHDTGKTRELLCNNCNLLIGMCRESLDILESAKDYLKKHKLGGPRERMGGIL
jgi:hypothetical protein